MKEKIRVWGGFHDADDIDIMVPAGTSEALMGAGVSLADVVGQLSDRVYRRVMDHMCGIQGCQCQINDWQWVGGR